MKQPLTHLAVALALALGASSVGARSDGARSDGARSVGARSDGARSDGARSVGAQSVGAQSSALDNAENGAFSLARFVAQYEAASNGRVYEIERERKQGRWVYDIESSRGDAVFETVVDAQTGELLAEEEENTRLWTPISADKKRALLASRKTLGELLAQSTIAGLQVAEVSSRLSGGRLLFLLKTADRQRIVLDPSQ